MKFTVTTLAQAEYDYSVILEFLAQRSKSGATAWARAFDKALERLEMSRFRWRPSPETE